MADEKEIKSGPGKRIPCKSGQVQNLPKPVKTLTRKQLYNRMLHAQEHSTVYAVVKDALGNEFHYPIIGVRITVADPSKPDFVELLLSKGAP